MIFTGEPDLRKPNPAIIRQVADLLGASYGKTWSVGDQEHSDIIPAKKIGLKTMRIGSPPTAADLCVPDIHAAVARLEQDRSVKHI